MIVTQDSQKISAFDKLPVARPLGGLPLTEVHQKPSGLWFTQELSAFFSQSLEHDTPEALQIVFGTHTPLALSPRSPRQVTLADAPQPPHLQAAGSIPSLACAAQPPPQALPGCFCVPQASGLWAVAGLRDFLSEGPQDSSSQDLQTLFGTPSPLASGASLQEGEQARPLGTQDGGPEASGLTVPPPKKSPKRRHVQHHPKPQAAPAWVPLPLGQHFRQLTQRADLLAFTPDALSEATKPALQVYTFKAICELCLLACLQDYAAPEAKAAFRHLLSVVTHHADLHTRCDLFDWMQHAVSMTDPVSPCYASVSALLDEAFWQLLFSLEKPSIQAYYESTKKYFKAIINDVPADQMAPRIAQYLQCAKEFLRSHCALEVLVNEFNSLQMATQGVLKALVDEKKISFKALVQSLDHIVRFNFIVTLDAYYIHGKTLCVQPNSAMDSVNILDRALQIVATQKHKVPLKDWLQLIVPFLKGLAHFYRKELRSVHRDLRVSTQQVYVQKMGTLLRSLIELEPDLILFGVCCVTLGTVEPFQDGALKQTVLKAFDCLARQGSGAPAQPAALPAQGAQRILDNTDPFSLALQNYLKADGTQASQEVWLQLESLLPTVRTVGGVAWSSLKEHINLSPYDLERVVQEKAKQKPLLHQVLQALGQPPARMVQHQGLRSYVLLDIPAHLDRLQAALAKLEGLDDAQKGAAVLHLASLLLISAQIFCQTYDSALKSESTASTHEGYVDLMQDLTLGMQSLASYCETFTLQVMKLVFPPSGQDSLLSKADLSDLTTLLSLVFKTFFPSIGATQSDCVYHEDGSIGETTGWGLFCHHLMRLYDATGQNRNHFWFNTLISYMKKFDGPSLDYQLSELFEFLNRLVYPVAGPLAPSSPLERLTGLVELVVLLRSALVKHPKRKAFHALCDRVDGLVGQAVYTVVDQCGGNTQNLINLFWAHPNAACLFGSLLRHYWMGLFMADKEAIQVFFDALKHRILVDKLEQPGDPCLPYRRLSQSVWLLSVYDNHVLADFLNITYPVVSANPNDLSSRQLWWALMTGYLLDNTLMASEYLCLHPQAFDSKVHSFLGVGQTFLDALAQLDPGTSKRFFYQKALFLCQEALSQDPVGLESQPIDLRLVEPLTSEQRASFTQWSADIVEALRAMQHPHSTGIDDWLSQAYVSYYHGLVPHLQAQAKAAVAVVPQDDWLAGTSVKKSKNAKTSKSQKTHAKPSAKTA